MYATCLPWESHCVLFVEESDNHIYTLCLLKNFLYDIKLSNHILTGCHLLTLSVLLNFVSVG